jgi:hypothetical protein
MKIGTVIKVKFKLSNEIILINDQCLDIKSLVEEFEESHQIRKSPLNFNDQTCDIWLDHNCLYNNTEYGNKFIFWLKKMGWIEISNKIKEIHIL